MCIAPISTSSHPHQYLRSARKHPSYLSRTARRSRSRPRTASIEILCDRQLQPLVRAIAALSLH